MCIFHTFTIDYTTCLDSPKRLFVLVVFLQFSATIGKKPRKMSVVRTSKKFGFHSQFLASLSVIWLDQELILLVSALFQSKHATDVLLLSMSA